MAGAKRELAPVRWGLIPAWAKDPADLPLLINARAEGIEEKASFRNAFRRRRCLVPASGFYEWQARGRGAKQPFYIAPPDGGLIAFAGLWETYAGRDGSEIDTGAIVTKAASESLAPIHSRMPVMLPPERFADWLDPATPPEIAREMLEEAEDGGLEPVPVSTRVNSVSNDDEGLIAPAEAEAPPKPLKPPPRQPDLF